jgi:hypothetical protein
MAELHRLTPACQARVRAGLRRGNGMARVVLWVGMGLGVTPSPRDAIDPFRLGGLGLGKLARVRRHTVCAWGIRRKWRAEFIDFPFLRVCCAGAAGGVLWRPSAGGRAPTILFACASWTQK